MAAKETRGHTKYQVPGKLYWVHPLASSARRVRLGSNPNPRQTGEVYTGVVARRASTEGKVDTVRMRQPHLSARRRRVQDKGIDGGKSGPLRAEAYMGMLGRVGKGRSGLTKRTAALCIPNNKSAFAGVRQSSVCQPAIARSSMSQRARRCSARVHWPGKANGRVLRRRTARRSSVPASENDAPARGSDETMRKRRDRRAPHMSLPPSA